MQRTLDCSAGAYQYVDIGDVSRRFGRGIETLPYVHRVLLENLARSQAWNLPVAENEIRAAIRFHIDGLKQDGQPVPQPTSIADYVEA